MEKLFKLKQNGTTVRTEVLAGLTTFMTMAYIIALNPNLIVGFGANAEVGGALWNGIFLATVHNMLLQSTPGSVDLLPGFAKEEGDVEFTLPAEGDLLVHARVQGGKLAELSFKKGENCTLTKLSVRLPAWLADAPMEVTL